VIVHVPVEPFVTEDEEPKETTVLQEGSMQSRKSTVPVSAIDGSEKDAARLSEFVVTPAAGETSVGTVGIVVFTMKLRVGDHDEPPTVSVPLTRQYHVPSARDGDELTVVPLTTALAGSDE
jgi:hypothetical protein